jgi:hypothetical protein
MSILSDESLEFAKEHIQKFYASDFFPKAIEYEALWHSWDEVKAELKSKNVNKFWVLPPHTATSLKPKGTFRVVHQLEPLDAIIYTALAYSIANKIEASRVPKDQNIACSYRFDLKDGSFFASGNGFEAFTNKSEELANTFDFVLVTDITDFYNQIYLHRLNNAIEFASSGLKPIADDIEQFLSKLNNKASQGVPVGPAASIIMSEAILIDIDNFIIGKGLIHTRYVDDYRIFSNTEESLVEILEELTLYLYENHRLTLSSDKTLLVESSKYIDEILHNQYEMEKIELYKTLEVFNPYSGEAEEIEVPITEDTEKANEIIEFISDKVLEKNNLDLGLSRSLIRKAKAYGHVALSDTLFEYFEFFSPVINDVCLYLDKITDDEFVDTYITSIKDIVNSDIMNRELVRFWFEWYISRNKKMMSDIDLKSFVMSGNNLVNQAYAAISSKDLSWVRDKKAEIFSVGNWERRAILYSAQVLPGDEKEHWLKLTMASSPLITDRWVSKWVLEAL